MDPKLWAPADWAVVMFAATALLRLFLPIVVEGLGAIVGIFAQVAFGMGKRATGSSTQPDRNAGEI